MFPNNTVHGGHNSIVPSPIACFGVYIYINYSIMYLKIFKFVPFYRRFLALISDFSCDLIYEFASFLCDIY